MNAKHQRLQETNPAKWARILARRAERDEQERQAHLARERGRLAVVQYQLGRVHAAAIRAEQAAASATATTAASTTERA